MYRHVNAQTDNLNENQYRMSILNFDKVTEASMAPV